MIVYREKSEEILCQSRGRLLEAGVTYVEI